MAEEGTIKKEKIRILAWGDYCCSTGFGTVMSNIMQELASSGEYEIDVLGINYSGDPYDEKRWPGRVYPAMPGLMSQAAEYADVYGRKRLLDMLVVGKYDVLFMLQDTFILQPIMPQLLAIRDELIKNKLKPFKTVYYYPIDSIAKPDWIKEVVAKIDFPVTYTKFAFEQSIKQVPALAERLKVIYHGTNTKEFYPIEDKKAVAEFRTKYFNGLADGKFLIVNVNRNQPRKDTVRNFLVIQELVKRGFKDFLVYLHMQFSDIGGNCFVMAQQLDMVEETYFALPSPTVFNANQGLPVDVINQIYNAADVIFTPTLGEGWGLSLTEAMATKTPIIAPNNTSITEILADNRGVLVPSGADPTAFITKENDNERIRPIMDVEKAADAIQAIAAGKLPDIEGAYKWATALSWKNICSQWKEIIDRAAASNYVLTESAMPMGRAERRALERQRRK